MSIEMFNKQAKSLQQEIANMQKKSNLISILRFLFIVGVIADLLIGYFQKKPILYILSLVCLILFMILVVIHQKLTHELNYKIALQNVYKEHISRKNNEWVSFFEDGTSFLDEKDYPSLDLDIFGHHSLFQFLNITFTKKGKERLASYLKVHDENINSLKERQVAVEELSRHEEFVIEMEAYGKLLHTKNEKVIYNFIESTKKVSLSSFSLIFAISPFALFIAILCSIFSIGLPYSFIVCEVLALLQLFLSLAFAGKHNELFEPISKLSKGLKSYLSIFKMIEKEKFESPLLKQIQKRIISDYHAIDGIQKLHHIADRMSYRQNLFAFIILNSLGLYDFWMKNQYMKWLNQYQSSIEIWFNDLSEIEAFMSLSVSKIDEFHVTMASLSDEKSLSFEQLRHPLIGEDKVIGNDFSLHHSLSIITGSNMSGKTTFMRTIGLNLILAYAGGYVFADKMESSLMHIMTSMRVKDNVEEGISTFYGELLRIKDMIEYAKQQEPMICFIDEIFKGTNSLDRIAGAKATMQKLSLPYCLIFLTTHDFELCEMKDMTFDNYHFDEYYKDHQIYFDYCMKSGKSQSTNGQFLLKQLGIMEDK